MRTLAKTFNTTMLYATARRENVWQEQTAKNAARYADIAAPCFYLIVLSGAQYYAAVGKLPPRLEQPLWRSPTASPSTAIRICGHAHAGPSRPARDTKLVRDLTADFSQHSPARDQSGIQQHQNEISRHRQQWEGPETPPGYWDIGFPDTQKEEEINQRARDMEARKKAKMRAEADKEGGRYRRR
jgi:hypothetical protein